MITLWLRDMGYPIDLSELGPSDFRNQLICIQSHLIKHFDRLQRPITIPKSCLSILARMNMIPMGHIISHYEHLKKVIPQSIRPSIEKILRESNDGSALTGFLFPPDKLKAEIPPELQTQMEGDYFCLGTDEAIDVIDVCHYATKFRHLEILADLLRANSISEQPLIRQLESIISHKLMSSNYDPDLSFELETSNISELVQVASQLQVDLETLPENSLVLYEDGSRIVRESLQSLIGILQEFDAEYFDTINQEGLQDLLEYGISSKIGIPIMNYLCLKLSEHPHHSKRFASFFLSQCSTTSTSSAVNQYLSFLKGLNEGAGSMAMYLNNLKDVDPALKQVIEANDDKMEVAELFSHVNDNYPYTLEQLIDEQSAEDSSTTFDRLMMFKE